MFKDLITFNSLYGISCFETRVSAFYQFIYFLESFNSLYGISCFETSFRDGHEAASCFKLSIPFMGFLVLKRWGF